MPEKHFTSITSDVIQALGESEKRFAKHECDFERVLDDWAEEYKEICHGLAFEYPREGSLREKYQVITSIFVANRIRGGQIEMEAHITRLRAGDTLAPIDCHQISNFERQLRGELRKSPHLKVEIDNTLDKIDELRVLFRASLGAC